MRVLRASAVCLIILAGALGSIAAPAYASSDGIWYLNCTTPSLQTSNPTSVVTCASGNVSAACAAPCGEGGFTSGSTSNVQLTIAGAKTGTVSGTYQLKTSLPTAGNFATGSFSGTLSASAGTSCSTANASNTLLGSGSSGPSGVVVASNAAIGLVVTFTSLPSGDSLCSGANSTTTATSSFAATVPEFAAGMALVVALGVAGLALLKKRAVLPSPGPF